MTAKFTSPHTAGATARLFSPLINNPTPSCVNFWYKTSGPIEFNVKKLNSNGVFDPNALFTATGDRGNEWSLGRGTLTSSGLRIQIVFEAIDKASNQRDAEVWLDDFEINYSQSCPPLGSCTFENDICGFSYSTAGDFDWVRLNGVFGLSQNIWSVPTFDHTTNNSSGSFLYLDTNGKDNGKKAIIESEIVSEIAGGQCLQFYLKTNSLNKATLKITRKNKINGDLADIFTSNEAATGDFWIIKEVQLPQTGFPYSYLFQGIVGQNIVGQKGQLAIDDITLLNLPCGSSQTTTNQPGISSTQTTNKPGSSISQTTTQPNLSSSTSNTPVTNTLEKCPTDYCLNGGTCTSLSSGFKCSCPVNFTGFRCQESLTQNKGKDSKLFLLNLLFLINDLKLYIFRLGSYCGSYCRCISCFRFNNRFNILFQKESCNKLQVRRF